VRVKRLAPRGGIHPGARCPRQRQRHCILGAVFHRYLAAVSALGLIEAPQPLTAAQISAARQLAASSGATTETKSGELGLGEISDGATALGILLALGVLVW
jgi:hypothetical protein